MLQSTANFCIVEIERKFQDKQGNLIIDTTWTPEEYATMEGTVVSVPLRVENDSYRNIFGKVEVGDRVVFSYGIIFHYLDQPDNDTPVYKNMILFEGKEYWKVDMAEIFCTVSPKGEIRMVTDNLLLERFHVEHSSQNITGIILPKEDNDHLVVVKAMPENIKLSCKVGDLISVEPKYIQKYNILGSEHFITPSRRVLAKR